MGLFNLFRFRSSFNSFSLVAFFLIFNISFADWSVSRPNQDFNYFSLSSTSFPVDVGRVGGGGASGGGGATSFFVLPADSSNSSATVSKCVQNTVQLGFSDFYDSNTSVKSDFVWEQSVIVSTIQRSYEDGLFDSTSSIISSILDYSKTQGLDWEFIDGKFYTSSDGSKQYYNGSDSSVSCWVGIRSSDSTCYTDVYDLCSNWYDPIISSEFYSFNGEVEVRGEPNSTGGYWSGGLFCGIDWKFPDSPVKSEFSLGSSQHNNIGSCPVGYLSDDFGCYTEDSSSVEVPLSEVLDFIGIIPFCSFDTFAFTELYLFSHFPDPSSVRLIGIDSFRSAPGVLTKTDKDGNILVTENSNSLDFDISDNVVTPEFKDKTDVYNNGDLVDSDLVVIPSPPFTGVSPPPVVTPNPPSTTNGFKECLDLPETCAYYGFVMEPFNPVPVSDTIDLGGADVGDVDLSSLISYDFNTGVSASCPLPYVLDLGDFGSIEVPFQPLCDVASSVKPFAIASSMIFAILIVLGSTKRNT